MISDRQHDVEAGTRSQPLAKQVGLVDFDGQRMSVVLQRGRKQVVMRGKATYVHDTAVGNALRIDLDHDEPGKPVFLLSENEWNGRIVPDFHHGCDFTLVINQ